MTLAGGRKSSDTFHLGTNHRVGNALSDMEPEEKSLAGACLLALAMGLLLFLPAGTLQYWQARLYLCVFFGMSVLITLYLMKKDPALLKRRLSAGPTAEKEKAQKIIMLFASIGFIGLLVVPALTIASDGPVYRPIWLSPATY